MRLPKGISLHIWKKGKKKINLSFIKNYKFYNNR